MTQAATQVRHAVFNAVLSVPHLLLLMAFIVPPTDFWAGKALHDDVVFHRETPAIIAQLRKNLPDNGHLAATAYTPASLLSFYAGSYVPVLGPGRFHARQDDVIVDFRLYDGAMFRVFDRKPLDTETLAPWFESVSTGSFEVAGITFFYADGVGFKYGVFRETVLKTVFDRYYQIPDVLPRMGCQFADRYGFELKPSRW
jgi:hypothetical protein